MVLSMKEINKKLQELLLAIVTDNVTLTETLMQEVYRQYKITRDNLLNLIFQMYMEYGKEGFINVVAKDKKKVDTLINDTLVKEVKIIGMLELSKINELLEQVYKDTYYKTSYILRSGIKKADKLKLVKKEHIESVVKTKFKGEMYSDRIWKNKEQMIITLKKELDSVMTGKKNLDQVIGNIKKEFNVTTYEASRLARTEMARVQTQANEDIARAEGIEWQMYDATLDGKTCDKCRDLDGKVYKIDDPNKPIPPLHPFTRSHLLDLPSKEWRPSGRWDNENRKIINYKNYKEWYEQQVKEQPDFQIKEKMHKNKSNDKKQFENYKEILGNDAPKSFDKFQELKYNNTKEWDRVSYKYKLETVYNLDKLKNTENFVSKDTIKHILEGEVNRRGKAVGFHMENMPTKKGEIIEQTRSKVNESGVYKAKVAINGVPKIAKSTFFPTNMTPQQVVDAINEAYNSKLSTPTSEFIGTTSYGFKIGMYLDIRGNITTAYPKF